MNPTKNLIALSSLSLLAAIVLLLPISRAQAQNVTTENLLDEARCDACHQQSEPSLGPPWQAIAARHGARKAVMVDVLARKIVNGGGGNWGLVPMVPNQWVNIEDAREMASWILEQNKKS